MSCATASGWEHSRAWSANDAPVSAIEKLTLGKTREYLSLIEVGGIVVMNALLPAANNKVAKSVNRGINYFDVALDTYKLACWLDYQSARAPYVDVFFKNLN